MLNGVDFWAVGGLLDQANVAWDDQLSGAMPPSLIDLHHDEVVSESLAEMLQEEIHRRRVSGRQNQGDKPPERRRESSKDIHRLTDQPPQGQKAECQAVPSTVWIERSGQSVPHRCRHDQNRSLIVGFPCCDCCLNLRREVFLKRSCSSLLPLGCFGRGMSLRHPCRLLTPEYNCARIKLTVPRTGCTLCELKFSSHTGGSHDQEQDSEYNTRIVSAREVHSRHRHHPGNSQEYGAQVSAPSGTGGHASSAT